MEVEETVIERKNKKKKKNVKISLVKKESKSNDVSIINKLIINAQEHNDDKAKADANKRPSDLLLTAQWALN